MPHPPPHTGGEGTGEGTGGQPAGGAGRLGASVAGRLEAKGRQLGSRAERAQLWIRRHECAFGSEHRIPLQVVLPCLQ